MVGSGLTTFALGVWVYQHTGSATDFALAAVFASLPGVLVLPLVGVLTDSGHKRLMIIGGNLVFSVGKLILAVLILEGQLQVWHIYVALAIGSGFAAGSKVTYSTIVSDLVPVAQFGRANSLLQAAQASAQVFPPLLAGLLLSAVGIPTIILIDLATYLIAIASLVGWRPPAAHYQPVRRRGAYREAMREALRYVRDRPALLLLLIYFVIGNLWLEMALILLTPLLLSVSSPQTTGMVLSVSGAGFMVGSIIMTAWGGPRGRVNAMLICSLLLGLACVVSGFRPHLVVISLAFFTAFLLIPIINGCSQTIWQCKTPRRLQGRVFALRRMVVCSSIPLAYLLAGPLAERVFQPLLTPKRAVRRLLPGLLPSGSGGAIACVFIFSGLAIMSLQFAAFMHPRFRFLERELPDEIEEN